MLMVAQLLKADAPPYPNLPHDLKGKTRYALPCFNDEMQDHWHLEENILFPLIAGRDPEIDQLIYQLEDDHVELAMRFERLGAEVNQTIAMDELGKLLEAHIRLEERQLFQRVQEVLNEDELQALDKAMNT
jgi:iron-sulfur cluster repair protein YtfE (RIC family)